LENWLALRDVLFRKYQRKRLPLKHLQTVDNVLESLGVRVNEHGEAEQIDHTA
jgi:hypothetical protein